MAEILKLTTDTDLAEFAVIEGCNRLGVTPHGETLVASTYSYFEADKIASRHQMHLVIVPPEMLKEPNAWAIVTKTRGIFWSRGCP